MRLWKPLPLPRSTAVALLLLAGCHGIPETPASSTAVAPQEAMFPTLKFNDELLKPLAPSNNRDWCPEQSQLARAEFQGNQVTVRNVRDCQWRRADDFTVAYCDKTYDLDKVRTVDFLVAPFNETPSLGHTMLSFGFDDGEYLALSVEIHKERGEAFNPISGFFRQYELIYILATERDVIQKRVNCDLCDVYLYRSTATPEQAREMLADVLRRTNKLAEKPEYYDTIANNCTTNIRRHINHLKSGAVPYDYRVLLPGYSDQLAYDLGFIERHGSYEETRQRARVNYVAYLHRDDPSFSQAIRR